MRWVDVDGVVDAIVQYNDEHTGEKKGTADLIVLTVPPREGRDVPKDSAPEDDDTPEPPLEPMECDEDEVEMLLSRLREQFDACKEA
jgi:hypothetical protein